MVGALFAFCIGYGLLKADERIWWRNLVFACAAYFIIDGAATAFHLGQGSSVIVCFQLLAIVAFMALAYFAINEGATNKFLRIGTEKRATLRIASGRGFIILGFLIMLLKLQDGDVSFDQADIARALIEQAQEGDVSAQHRLPQLYYSGAGVPVDCETGYMWWIIANAGRRTMGGAAKPFQTDDDVPCLTHDQILSARTRADQWLHNHKQ